MNGFFKLLFSLFMFSWILLHMLLVAKGTFSNSPPPPLILLSGYLGPGGISEHGDHEGCTGGIHRYVDIQLFTNKLIYHYPTCLELYNCQWVPILISTSFGSGLMILRDFLVCYQPATWPISDWWQALISFKMIFSDNYCRKMLHFVQYSQITSRSMDSLGFWITLSCR